MKKFAHLLHTTEKVKDFRLMRLMTLAFESWVGIVGATCLFVVDSVYLMGNMSSWHSDMLVKLFW